MSKRSVVVAVALVVSGLVLAGSVMGGEAAGTISEKGFGSFKLADKDGTQRLFNESSRSTRYEPDSWRPAMGDKVSVTYTEVQKKSGIVLAVDLVKLVKRGPNSVEISSPADVEIIETGRSGVKATIKGKVVRFSTGRTTTWSPTGWAPNVGDKARITFHTQASRINVGVMGYVADSIEQVK
jgi:hypothetical protein